MVVGVEFEELESSMADELLYRVVVLGWKRKMVFRGGWKDYLCTEVQGLLEPVRSVLRR